MIWIIIILFCFWYLNKNSKNDYFKNAKIEDYDLIMLLFKNFDIKDDNFVKAWNYFKYNPKQYNGTSVINDRWLIKGLEPMSVTHDYEYIVAKSFRDLHKANKKYCVNLRKINTNWIWCWCFIFCGLTILSIFKSIKYAFKS
jgi:hypothetical protein